MRKQDRILIPDEELNAWADFFVAAGLYPLMKFGEFIREPEAIIAALCDLAAPMPTTLPKLRERVAALAEVRRCEVIDLQKRRARLQAVQVGAVS
jgi:LPS sulfotransferase NodH